MAFAAGLVSLRSSTTGRPAQNGFRDTTRFVASKALARLGRDIAGRAKITTGWFFPTRTDSKRMVGTPVRTKNTRLSAVVHPDVSIVAGIRENTSEVELAWVL